MLNNNMHYFFDLKHLRDLLASSLRISDSRYEYYYCDTDLLWGYKITRTKSNAVVDDVEKFVSKLEIGKNLETETFKAEIVNSYVKKDGREIGPDTIESVNGSCIIPVFIHEKWKPFSDFKANMEEKKIYYKNEWALPPKSNCNIYVTSDGCSCGKVEYMALHNKDREMDYSIQEILEGQAGAYAGGFVHIPELDTEDESEEDDESDYNN